MSAQELYTTTIKPLPAAERLRLATLILNDLQPESVVDVSESWSDEDLSDFTAAGWRRAEVGGAVAGGEVRVVLGVKLEE